MAGVQQPGMTGQVKENIISRFFELGVSVQNGQIEINPIILKKPEFIVPQPDADYKHPYIEFTYCKVPVVYLLDENQGIDIINSSGEQIKTKVYKLSKKDSYSIMSRDGKIERLVVHL